MADSIVRLKVDSQEYDNKLKHAAEGLQRYVESARQAGVSLEQAKGDTLEFVRAVGQMETKSISATGKLSEMKKAFTELSVQYKNLTDQEKQSPYGRALAASLEQLKGRISESKSQLDEVNKSLNGNSGLSGALDSLAGKFGVNIQSLAGWGAALGAAKAALDVAKDAFFANEQQLDEWGRIVESSHSLYNGFLDALNTGDITGYLRSMNDIVQAARDAYDALDTLNTYNAFNQIQMEKKRTNMTESIADFRSGTGTREAVRAAGEAYKKELRDRQKLENKAYLEAVRQKAAERGVNYQDLLTAMSGEYGSYQSLKATPLTGTRQTVVGSGMFARMGTEKYAANATERLGQALNRINDDELKALQAMGAQAQRTSTEIAQIDRQLARVLNGRSGGGGGSSTGRGGRSTGTAVNNDPVAGSIDYQSKKVQELQKAWRAAADDDSRQKIKVQIDEAQHSLDLMTGKVKETTTLPAQTSGLGNGSTPLAGLDTTITNLKSPLEQLTEEMNRLAEAQAKALTPEAWQAYQRQIEATQEKMDDFTGQTSKGAKDNDKSWQHAASAIASVGSAMQSIEDPAAKIVGTVAQAIATIALGYAEATKQAATMGPWAWVAFAATGMATMLSTISAIHSATGFSEGGQVKGNTYSGDQIYSRLDAGEVVLTRAMAGNLASQLNSPAGNLSLSASVEGEKIFLATNRFLKRSGRGEFVTWK